MLLPDVVTSILTFALGSNFFCALAQLSLEHSLPELFLPLHRTWLKPGMLLLALKLFSTESLKLIAGAKTATRSTA